MAKRKRARRAQGGQNAPSAQRLRAPDSDYDDADGNVLTLRGSFKAAARLEYADTLAGLGARASTTQDDAWQRAVELLFERLAVRWTIAGSPIERQRELLARFRVASSAERAFVRDALRKHCAEHFRDVKAP